MLALAGAFVRVAAVGASEPAAGIDGDPPVAAHADGPYLPPAGLRVPVGEEAGPAAPVASSAFADMIVFVSDGDLWLDDLDDADEPRLLIDNGDEQSSWSPRFVDRESVSFVSEKGLEILDLATGRRSVVAGNDPWIGAYDWSPDGSRVAYMTSEWDEQRQVTRGYLRVVTRAGVAGEIPFSLIVPDGYCIHDPDGAFTVEFSPDGTSILVENVAAQPQPSVTVVSVTGETILEPSHLVWAGFDHDGTLVARELGTDDWVRLSLTSGRVEQLPVPDKARRPALSPLGRSIAVDDGVGTVTLIDLAHGASSRPLRGYLNPVWLDDERVIAFAVRACDQCEMPWEQTGDATLFDANLGERPLRIDFAQIDVLRR